MIKKLYSRAYDLLDEVDLLRKTCDKVVDNAYEYGYKTSFSDNTDDNIYYSKKLNDYLSDVEYNVKRLIQLIDFEIPTESKEEKDFVDALEDAFEEI